MGKPILYRFRIPRADRKVVASLMLAAAPELQGRPLARAAGIDAETAYAALARLEAAGWVEHRQEGWEDLAQRDRRFYRLTDAGRSRAGR